MLATQLLLKTHRRPGGIPEYVERAFPAKP
jgi:hypothetical protein